MMSFYQYLVSAALLILCATTHSQPILAIDGLSTRMEFAAATMRAETLGGRCEIMPPRRKVNGNRAQCYFSDCPETAPGANCERDGLPKSSFELAGQPVVMIEFEAHAGYTLLNSAGLFFAGDFDAVMLFLVDQFGEPVFDTAQGEKKSWTRARRIMWKTGIHRLSLMDSPKMVLMVAERDQSEE